MPEQGENSRRGWRRLGRRVLQLGLIGLLLSLLTAGVGIVNTNRVPSGMHRYWDADRSILWMQQDGVTSTRTIFFLSPARTFVLADDPAVRQRMLDAMLRGYPPRKLGRYSTLVGDDFKGESLYMIEVGSPLRLARGLVESGVDGTYPTKMFKVRVGPGGAGRVYMIPNRPIAVGLLADVVFWAVAWLAVSRMTRAAQRMVRINRGGCTQCGYDVGSLKVCPECGFHRDHEP